MTIKEFYDWAVKNHLENLPIARGKCFTNSVGLIARYTGFELEPVFVKNQEYLCDVPYENITENPKEAKGILI